MDAQIEDRPVGQIINWYLVHASKEAESEPSRIDLPTLKRKWAAADQHLGQEFRARPFSEVSTIEMQGVIDDVAAKSERSAQWIRRILSDVDEFAVRHGLIGGVRTKRLLAPTGSEAPRILDDAGFRRTWETLWYCGTGGALIDRAPCLAMLLSAVTLQPLGQLITMRRDEVDAAQKLWTRAHPVGYAYLSDLAFEIIAEAIHAGDIAHRGGAPEYVFVSAGPKRDPRRPMSYSFSFDVVRRHVSKTATPHDLQQTGIHKLRGLGGDDLKALVRSLIRGNLETVPDGAAVALLDGWAAYIRQITARRL